MALQGVDVCPPHSLSMESSTPECVERSLDINMELLMHFGATKKITGSQLMITMSMVLASLMEKDQGNIFGHLQLLMTKHSQIDLYVPALRPTLTTLEWSHHS